jgi:hypothetical protein
MQFDTTLSLDAVIAILALLGAVWRLDNKIDRKVDSLRSELKDYIISAR